MYSTIDSSVVWLDEGFLDLAALNHQGITLAAAVAEDGCAVKAQVESLGEFASGVSQKTNLKNSLVNYFVFASVQEVD